MLHAARLWEGRAHHVCVINEKHARTMHGQLTKESDNEEELDVRNAQWKARSTYNEPRWVPAWSYGEWEEQGKRLR